MSEDLSKSIERIRPHVRPSQRVHASYTELAGWLADGATVGPREALAAREHLNDLRDAGLITLWVTTPAPDGVFDLELTWSHDPSDPRTWLAWHLLNSRDDRDFARGNVADLEALVSAERQDVLAMLDSMARAGKVFDLQVAGPVYSLRIFYP